MDVGLTDVFKVYGGGPDKMCEITQQQTSCLLTSYFVVVSCLGIIAVPTETIYIQ